MLDSLEVHWHSDHNLPARIERLIKSDKRLGSRDRKLYRELIYTALRYLPWVEPILKINREHAIHLVAWLCEETAATTHFKKEALVGWPHPEQSLDKKEVIIREKLNLNQLPLLLPEWLKAEAPDAFKSAHYACINQRAPLWLRLQTQTPDDVFNEFKSLGWTWSSSNSHPYALKMLRYTDVTKSNAYLSGKVEIQDIGSQLILESIGLKEPGRWLDACAGAGGKSLQLATLLGPNSNVECFDIRSHALDELNQRAHRAGLSLVIKTVDEPSGTYDGVLVDAPCSGTGTWRRSPHLKWVTTQLAIHEYARKQSEILSQSAKHVKVGGRLIYATCSLCSQENELQIENFLKNNPNFSLTPFPKPCNGENRRFGLLFWPDTHDGDGYFVASMIRIL
jgi:16S rRNA (cytosine967-C5)-methyltransferase